MKPYSYCSLALIATLAAQLSAIQLVERTSPASLPSLDTTRRSIPRPAVRDRLRKLRKRSSLQVTLDNESTLYFASVSLGTPQQSLQLDIDTGSSDIWANSALSTLCQQYSQECSTSGTYNANKSSSYKYTSSDFLIKYADGSYAQGDYATDTLNIGGKNIGSVPFGIGYSSTSSQGILGLGYAANEATVGTSGRIYHNLPEILAGAGLTSSVAYSLWLNDLDANTGSVLFGGVDTEKYQGNLQTLPIIQEAGEYREFFIALTSVTAAGQTIISSSNPVAVLLDSGSSLSYLPDDAAQSLFNVLNAQYNEQSGAAVVDCGLRDSQQTVSFGFSGVTINVPMDELVIVDSVRRGQETCILGISAAGDSTSVLGDTFLRSAYVVYDLSNNQISLAQTDFNATDSSVKEIASGSSGVPGAKVVTNAVSVLAVETGGARNGGPDLTAFGSIAAAATPAPIPLGRLVAVAAAGVALAL